MTDPIEELDGRIARLDELIATRDDARRGLGLRLALGLAREIRRGVPPGTETSDLVASWSGVHGPDAVEEAVAQARVLLRDPARLAEEIGRRIEAAKTESDLSGVEDGGASGDA